MEGITISHAPYLQGTPPNAHDFARNTYLQIGVAEPQINLWRGRPRAVPRDEGHEAAGILMVPDVPLHLEREGIVERHEMLGCQAGTQQIRHFQVAQDPGP